MAAGNTYVALAANTLSSPATSVTFSAISGAYTDLVIVVDGSASSSGFDATIQFNEDTGSNYSSTAVYGTGYAAQSSRVANNTFIWGDRNSTFRSSATSRTILKINIMNYSNTTTYKTTLGRADSALDGAEAIVGLWRSTAAITSVNVGGAGNNFSTGTTFTLYGIAAA